METTKTKSVTVAWFEIPVREWKRAILFYEEVFQTKLDEQDFGGIKMAFFPWDDSGKGAGGSLVKADEHYTPGQEGTLVYFSCENLSDELSRVENAGGKILQPRTQISPEFGYMAMFKDTEGNRIALYTNA